MSTSNFNLRGIPSKVMILLKKDAKKLNTSINSLILTIIEHRLGLTPEKLVHHDLDHLAGSWSASEEKIFTKNTQFFEQIDKELWK